MWLVRLSCSFDNFFPETQKVTEEGGPLLHISINGEFYLE